ncbi:MULTISPECIES: outer membrane protein assembly factor BamB [Methylobacillus]|uniref:Outer membrane protein assembly factor BamB n=1 Tax=Methylobacillus flagellatus (strain ATCC 51484 / DSM 6875 / VKM B-1610 / KT) TaxID=265072 RepID=Q1H0V4_METFK|nr:MULTISPECIES: outer membrane protein assembly factor BamB [Methylobacillus]ABE49883.1 Pyrrolo-quinoline quinone [Methylobacillus flagellatus KT]MPS48892.1 outer membrane protein assembly factor BamB [Methylobacillus sp.]
MRSISLSIAAAVLLGGCSTISDLKTDISERVFGRDQADPPAELVEFKPTLKPRIVWSAKVGESGLADFMPAAADGFVYAASGDGEIAKFDAVSGKQVWKVNAGEALTGGVGLGSGLVLVGTPKGYVLAYDLDGKLLWKSKVSSEVLSAPQVENDVVVVRCGDSRIFGLNAKDGARKWVYERATPTLTLRSSAGVTIADNIVYAGFAGGKLVSLRADDGKTLWEASVALPKGTTELERIADITSLPVVDGPLVYAVAYQGRVAAVERTTGRVAWTRDISSYTGLGAEDARVYVSHASGAVFALDYSSGRTFWRQPDLKNRQLSAPLPMGGVVVVGDVEGYLHFMDRDEGNFVARLQTEKGAVMPQPVALGTNGFLVQTRKGGLYAVSVVPQ